jgi:hypothetical protein
VSATQGGRGNPRLNAAFLALWWVPGVALLVWSVQTVRSAPSLGHHQGFHAALIGSVEAISAVLFLIPRTMRPGAAGLILACAAALLVHGLAGQLRGDLVVYATVVAYVAVHGPVRLRGGGA